MSDFKSHQPEPWANLSLKELLVKRSEIEAAIELLLFKSVPADNPIRKPQPAIFHLKDSRGFARCGAQWGVMYGEMYFRSLHDENQCGGCRKR